MKKLSILFILTQLTTNLIAQKEANNWALGNYQLDFKLGQPEVKFEYAEYLNRGIGLISDENGDMLFYSDGFSIWNKNHQLMPNGTELIPSHGSTSTQESLVIPDPSNNQLYYLFTVDPWNGQGTSGLYYSIIDLSLEGGLGDVTTRGEKLLDNTTNKISAIFHENLEDYWVVVHEHNTNNYYVFLVNSDGVSNSPVLNQIGDEHGFWDGQLKFSPDGKKIACSREYNNSDNTALDLFDFDPITGRLSNEINLILPADRDSEGLDFSSDAKKLYVAQSGSSGESGLYQFDLEFSSKEEIQNSRKLLHREVNNGFRQLQLAPDGKIYITKGGGGGGTGHLGVISNLNDLAENVDVDENGLFLEGGSSFVNYTPNFIQNYFFKTSFLYEGSCQLNPTYFRITNTHLLESVLWDFGDGTTSTETHPGHTFAEAGANRVTLTANYADHSDVITRDIIIDLIPILELGEDIELCFGSTLSIEDIYTEYRWNTNDTTNTTRVSNTGYYVLEVTNEFGCSSKDSVYVDVIELPQINLSDTLLLENESVVANPGQFNSYSWSTGERTQSISISTSGWYSILVSNDFGCESSKSFYVSDGSEIDEKPSRWTRLNPTPTSLTGNDIFFMDDYTGFIVNGEQLFITKDQGNSWEEFMDLDFGYRISFKENYGYILGKTGSVYKSTYNGEGWNQLEENLNDNLNSITQLSKDSIFITSDHTLFKSFDGGITWEELNIPNVDVEDSYFVSENIGHVACTNGTILKTTDGGETWYETETSNTFPSNFFRITFANELIGYATQEHNDVYKTTDGGETWHEIASLDAGYAIQFIDENIGFITGEYGASHKTEDGGETWSWIGFDGRRGGNSLYGIHFINEDIGFATGLRGRIIRTYDGGSSWENYSLTYNTISDIEIETDEIVFALVGNDILKSSNQGVEWTNLGSAAIGGKTRKIDFINNEIGFAIAGGTPGTSASSNYIYKTVDGGTTWTRQNTEQLGYGSTNLSAMTFINENIGIVSTDQSLVFKTVDSGISWTEMNSPGNRIREFQFTDTNVGYAINAGNYYGRVYKTIDGGENWEMIYEDEGDEIHDMHFINSEVGYLIGGRDLELRKTIDGGTTWEAIDIPYNWYEDVHFHSEYYGFIFDEDGQVFETLDGGENWNRLYELNGTTRISSLGNQLYAYGPAGSILYSEITLADQVRFDPITISEIRDSNVTISSKVLSSFNGEITIEYGTSKGDLEDVSFGSVNSGEQIDLYNEIDNLQESTRYNVRYKISLNNQVAYSQSEEFETWAYDDMFNLGEVSVKSVESETSKITFDLESYLDKTVLQLDIGLESDIYFRTDFVEEYTTYVNENIIFTIKQLEPETEYFIRVKVVDGEKTTLNDELSFITLEEPVEPLAVENKVGDVIIYPNPTSGLIQLSSESKISSISIMDLSGKVISNKLISGNQVDISHVNTGTYLIKIKHSQGSTVLPIFKN